MLYNFERRKFGLDRPSCLVAQNSVHTLMLRLFSFLSTKIVDVYLCSCYVVPMAPSLRSYLYKLSKLLGLTPIALYERQRELVRAGLLHAEGTRGPGAGVRLSPELVAVLLISVLATDSLSEVAERTREIAGATARPIFPEAALFELELTLLKQRDDPAPDRWQEEIVVRMHDLIDEIDWCMGPEDAKRLSDFTFTSSWQDKIEDRANALTEETRRQFNDAKRRPHRCRVTGASTFKDALARILADPQMVREVLIRVDRGTKEANIEFTPGPKSEHSRTRFVSGRDGERRESGLEVTATIRILKLPKFASDLASDAGAEDG